MKMIIRSLLVALLFTISLTAHTKDTTSVQTRPKVGLVLSGGGAKGAAHIDVLKYIEEAGIPIDYIAGTSMGSIVGGMYALGYTSEEILDIINNAGSRCQILDRYEDRSAQFRHQFIKHLTQTELLLQLRTLFLN